MDLISYEVEFKKRMGADYTAALYCRTGMYWGFSHK